MSSKCLQFVSISIKEEINLRKNIVYFHYFNVNFIVKYLLPLLETACTGYFQNLGTVDLFDPNLIMKKIVFIYLTLCLCYFSGCNGGHI